MRQKILLILVCCLAFGLLAAGEPKREQLLQQYRSTLSSLAENDDAGHQRLAQWCTAKGLTAEADHVWQILVDHKKARIKTRTEWQELVAWCRQQGLKAMVEAVSRDLVLFDYREKRAKLAADDAKGMQELAAWCQQNRLLVEALDLLRTVLVLQPDQASVRKQVEVLQPQVWSQAPTGLLRHQTLPSYTQQTAWFHLWVPKEHAQAKTGLPLIIFLHGGAHDAGTADNVVALAEILPAFKSAMVLFPNHLRTWWSHPREMTYLLDTLDLVLTRWRVDPQRIYLMGASMGGNGTWGFGSHCPELFAALAPLSGFWAPFLEFPMLNLKNMPIRVLHGTKDQTVPIDGARQAVALLKAEKADITLQEVDCAHQLPNEEIGKIAEWLLRQRNTHTFDLRTLKERVGRLPVPGWLKQYQGN